MITMLPLIDRFDFMFEQNNCNGINDCIDHNNLEFFNPDFDTLSRIIFEGGEYFMDDFSVIVRPPL